MERKISLSPSDSTAIEEPAFAGSFFVSCPVNPALEGELYCQKALNRWKQQREPPLLQNLLSTAMAACGKALKHGGVLG